MALGNALVQLGSTALTGAVKALPVALGLLQTAGLLLASVQQARAEQQRRVIDEVTITDIPIPRSGNFPFLRQDGKGRILCAFSGGSLHEETVRERHGHLSSMIGAQDALKKKFPDRITVEIEDPKDVLIDELREALRANDVSENATNRCVQRVSTLLNKKDSFVALFSKDGEFKKQVYVKDIVGVDMMERLGIKRASDYNPRTFSTEQTRIVQEALGKIGGVLRELGYTNKQEIENTANQLLGNQLREDAQALGEGKVTEKRSRVVGMQADVDDNEMAETLGPWVYTLKNGSAQDGHARARA